MALIPSTGFPATAYPVLPSFTETKIRQFVPATLPIGNPGDLSYGGRSTVDPISGSHI